MQPPLTLRLGAALSDLALSWTVMLIALWPATVAGGLGAIAWLVAVGPPSGPTTPWAGLQALGLITVGAIPYAFAFSVLALPFLPFRHWIVARRPPFLKAGYAAVAAFGHALLALVPGWSLGGFLAVAGLYEAIALVATLAFAGLAPRFGLDLDHRSRPSAIASHAG